MNEISFIHIGYHKTASTYLQKNYFPKFEGIRRVNNFSEDQDLDKWFFNKFINVNPHEFDSQKFLEELSKINCESFKSSDSVKYFISDENLSGDIYTGIDSKEIMSRIYDTFGKVNILIVIRNQVDFILSAYSNYVLHGGCRSLKSWINSQDTFWGAILSKLCYSHLIQDYQEVFGVDKVQVIPYEHLWNDEGGIRDYLYSYDSISQVSSTKSSSAMKGRGLASNRLCTIINKFVSNEYVRLKMVRVISIMDKSNNNKDRQYVINLLKDNIGKYNADNEITFNSIGRILPDEYKFT